jgi:hypothetical protein
VTQVHFATRSPILNPHCVDCKQLPSLLENYGISLYSLVSILLQHDYSRPHTARATIQDLHFECLPHPPYASDLAPSSYHMLGPLREVTGRKEFRPDGEVQQTVQEWLRRQPHDFFLEECIYLVNIGGPVLKETETM